MTIATIAAAVLALSAGGRGATHPHEKKNCSQMCNEVVDRCKDACKKARSHQDECKAGCGQATDQCRQACAHQKPKMPDGADE